MVLIIIAQILDIFKLYFISTDTCLIMLLSANKG